MGMAENVAITTAVFFFITGLVTGIWKYMGIIHNSNASAPVSVDVLHRATLLYSFACLVLREPAHLSVYSDDINLAAVLIVVVFFFLANVTYLVHGILRDTDNQFKKPYHVGPIRLPAFLIHGFMISLILSEIGGTLVLAAGALTRIWGW